MNKFLTFAGSQPVYLGDIDFMQNAAGAAFTQLVRALMDSADGTLNAILQGVESNTNGNNVTISPGVVVLNGEVLPFEGTTINPPSTLYFHVESTLSGERTFKDGNTHDCYETRKAIINTTSEGGILFTSVPRYHVPSDDKVYVQTSVTGFVTDAKLVRKSGLWFLDAVLNVPHNSSGTSATIIFSGLISAHMASISEIIKFSAPAVLYNETDGDLVQPLVCQFIKTGANAVTVYLFFPGDEQLAHGTGNCSVQVPFFY